jgi:hypothetical protein
MAAQGSELVPKYLRLFGRGSVYASLIIATSVSLSISALTGNALTTRELMSADGLWTLALMRDIFTSGGHLADWNLAQHSDFFPDKIFAAIAYTISSQPETWLLAFEALNLALYFVIAWYCLWLYLRRLRQHGAFRGIALWGALLATALPSFLRSWGILDNYFRYIGGPAHHFGPYFCGILAAFIAIDCFERPLNRRTLGRVAVACSLMMLIALSDKLAIFIAIPGLLVAAIYVVAVWRCVPPALPACCLLFCAATALAYVIGDPLWNSITEITPAVPNFDPARLKRQVGLLLESLLARRDPVDKIESVGVLMPQWHDWYGLSDFVHHLDPARSAIVAAAILFAGTLAATRMRRAFHGMLNHGPSSLDRPTADAFIVYLVASTVLLPMGLIAAGVLYSYGVELYLYPAAYCILWAAAAKVCERIPATSPRPQLVLGIATTSLLLSAEPLDFSAPPFQRGPKPPLVKCLEEFAKTRNLQLGLGSHWETYPVEFWSEGQIIVRAIFGDARISHWINDYEWYAPRHDGRLFTFIIDGTYLDEAALREKIGNPVEVLDCAAFGHGFSDRRILYYDRAGAERLTARITGQYQRSEHR